jgi:hypothetical protein
LQTRQFDPTGKKPAARQLVSAVDRAIRIMALLESSSQRTFSSRDSARTLGVPKSTAFNNLRRTRARADAAPLRESFPLGRQAVHAVAPPRLDPPFPGRTVCGAGLDRAHGRLLK